MRKMLALLLAAMLLAGLIGTVLADEDSNEINWDDPSTQKLYKEVGFSGEIEVLGDTGIRIYVPYDRDNTFRWKVLNWDEASDSDKEKGEYGCFFNEQGNLYIYIRKATNVETIDEYVELEPNGATNIQRVNINGISAIIYNIADDSKETTVVCFADDNSNVLAIRFELKENTYVDMERIRNLITLLIYSIGLE